LCEGGRVCRTASVTMAPSGGDSSQPGVPVKFVSAGLAGCVAETVTIPIDTAKVRLQVVHTSITHPYRTDFKESWTLSF